MNRDEILRMEAGREMDALVAEKVMDRTVMGGFGGTALRVVYHGKDTPAPLPYYSTNIAQAWEVVKRLDLLRDYVLGQFPDGGTYTWEVGRRDASLIMGRCCPVMHVLAMGLTAPLAICRAALLAVMEANE